MPRVRSAAATLARAQPDTGARRARMERRARAAAAQRKRQFHDVDAETKAIAEAVKPWTMTSVDKRYALIMATRYIARHRIPGAFVECGVWRGGSIHAIARTLERAGDLDRELYLFDTFDGMPPPEDVDVRWDGKSAEDLMTGAPKTQKIWAYASREDVEAGLARLPYPQEKFHLVQGRVEETIPAGAPDQIALLRLDTDWYASTKHELEHLYPRLAPGGVLIIDDYGSFEGARKATDEWLENSGEPLLLQRCGVGRIAVKPGPV
jgi:O-methyltransferase